MEVSLEKMQAAIGSLLLLWSEVERKASEIVSHANNGQLPKSCFGIAATLNAWKIVAAGLGTEGSLAIVVATTLRHELQRPLDIRNGICHGLVGISSAFQLRPACLTWEINGERQNLTWDEMQIVLAWLSKVPIAMTIIAEAAHETNLGRMRDTIENRSWWEAEFGLPIFNE